MNRRFVQDDEGADEPFEGERRRQFAGGDGQRVTYMPRMKPGIFTGEGDFLEWHSKFEVCARLGNWPEDVKVMTMCASLEGNARKFYMGLGPEDTERYTSLVAALRARYASKNQKEKYVARLESRKRRPGESIRDLGDDIWHLAQRAFPEFDKKPLEILAVKYLYGCINNELRIKCVENKCSSVHEAVEVVERYEALYETSAHASNNDGHDKHQLVAQDHSQVLDHLVRAVGKLEGKLENQGQAPGRSCYGCGKEGHMRRECPLNTYGGGQRQDRENNGRGRQRGQLPQCYSCGQMGHIARFCQGNAPKLLHQLKFIIPIL